MSTDPATIALGDENALDLFEVLLADSANLARDADTVPLRRLLGRVLSIAPDDARARLWREASVRVGYCPPHPTLDSTLGPLAVRSFVAARGLPDAANVL